MVLLWAATALATGSGVQSFGNLTGTSSDVYVGPGQQSDPHVSGDLVAYTSLVDGVSEIRYHDLSSGADDAIPTGGAFDFLSDISGSTIVFTRVDSSREAIYRFDVTTQGPAVELAPEAGSRRRGAAVGGTIAAWQDFAFAVTSEIVITDFATEAVTRLTDDSLTDRAAAVGPGGTAVVWLKCQTETSGCDVWQATPNAGSWVSMPLTGTEGEESLPDTNGQLVVYGSARTVDGVLERDIYWQSVGGSSETRLALVGVDSNPNIAGSLIAFERRDPATPGNADIFVYEVHSDVLFRVTETEENESLNDISVSEDGLVRVVWTRSDDGDQNVYAYSFRLTEGTQCDDADGTTCEDPGSRPVLGTLSLTRGTGAPQTASLAISGTSGAGLLCVRNDEATSGKVWLNGEDVIDSGDFKKSVTAISREVTLTGEDELSARIAGRPGSSFEVTLYGESACRVASYRVREGRVAQLSGSSETGRTEVSGTGTMGCSASGDASVALVLVLMAIGWIILDARRVRVPARRSSRQVRRRR